MLKPSRGVFITFEGTEGSGKSTLIKELSTLLSQSGYPTVTTREPGGSPLAERIRALILENAMDPYAELFLYEAARAEHVAKIIHPALSRGEIVLCDRFTDSTLAYQSHARGLSWNTVKRLNTIATSGLKPDLVVFLDLPPEKGLARVSDPNRFEAEGVEFQNQVRKGFLKAKAQNPSRWMTLYSDRNTPSELAQAILKRISPKLKARKERRGRLQ